MKKSVYQVICLMVVSALVLSGCNLPIKIVVNTNETQEATKAPELPTATLQME